MPTLRTAATDLDPRVLQHAIATELLMGRVDLLQVTAFNAFH